MTTSIQSPQCGIWCVRFHHINLSCQWLVVRSWKLSLPLFDTSGLIHLMDINRFLHQSLCFLPWWSSSTVVIQDLCRFRSTAVINLWFTHSASLFQAHFDSSILFSYSLSQLLAMDVSTITMLDSPYVIGMLTLGCLSLLPLARLFAKKDVPAPPANAVVVPPAVVYAAASFCFRSQHGPMDVWIHHEHFLGHYCSRPLSLAMYSKTCLGRQFYPHYKDCPRTLSQAASTLDLHALLWYACVVHGWMEYCHCLGSCTWTCCQVCSVILPNDTRWVNRETHNADVMPFIFFHTIHFVLNRIVSNTSKTNNMYFECLGLRLDCRWMLDVLLIIVHLGRCHGLDDAQSRYIVVSWIIEMIWVYCGLPPGMGCPGLAAGDIGVAVPTTLPANAQGLVFHWRACAIPSQSIVWWRYCPFVWIVVYLLFSKT